MVEAIASTPYEWTRWRGRVVLFKRVSLKPLWGLCVFAAGYFAALSVLAAVMMIVQDASYMSVLSPARLVLIALIFVAFTYAFVREYRSGEGLLLPVRLWRIGRGIKLAVQTLRIPQPTTMGGTQPGAPMRWLVVTNGDSEPRRIVQVYRDLELMRVNNALAGL